MQDLEQKKHQLLKETPAIAAIAAIPHVPATTTGPRAVPCAFPPLLLESVLAAPDVKRMQMRMWGVCACCASPGKVPAETCQLDELSDEFSGESSGEYEDGQLNDSWWQISCLVRVKKRGESWLIMVLFS